MKDLRELNHYRDYKTETLIMGKIPSEEELKHFGCFMIPTKGYRKGLKVIVSSGDIAGTDGWDHVSVSLPNRTPTWEEMDKVKRMFFQPHEVCFQLHPEESDHISNHPYCLHIWRNSKYPVPLPPAGMVGDKKYGSLKPGSITLETLRAAQVDCFGELRKDPYS